MVPLPPIWPCITDMQTRSSSQFARGWSKASQSTGRYEQRSERTSLFDEPLPRTLSLGSLSTLRQNSYSEKTSALFLPPSRTRLLVETRTTKPQTQRCPMGKAAALTPSLPRPSRRSPSLLLVMSALLLLPSGLCSSMGNQLRSLERPVLTRARSAALTRRGWRRRMLLLRPLEYVHTSL